MEGLTLTIKEQVQTRYEEKRVELVKIIEAFEKLEESKEWQTVKELVFNKSLESIEKLIMSESIMPVIDEHKLYRLQGEWMWAKKFTDINRYIETTKKQLADIKTKLHE